MIMRVPQKVIGQSEFKSEVAEPQEQTLAPRRFIEHLKLTNLNELDMLKSIDEYVHREVWLGDERKGKRCL